ncbi:MAG TPA: DUF6114 domain-containing protein [Nocardioidaceae bacterium]|nr:DUF6114 domain-containing protein [Nocardioidaceae bacterium]
MTTLPLSQRAADVAALLAALRWFRAFRRTRPFWGGLWLGLGGIWLLTFANMSIGLALGGGWNQSAAYVIGGGMLMFALTAWFAPFYSALVGFTGVLLALAAFVSVNLGGFLIGSLLGIVGGAMVWGWGEKKPRKQKAEAA